MLTRRELIKAYGMGGLAALFSLGLPQKEALAIEKLCKWGGTGYAGAGQPICNPANDYVGDRNVRSGANGETYNNLQFCIKYVPTCSGSLGTAHIYSNGSISGVHMKIAVYHASGSIPVSDDEMVSGCTPAICTADGGTKWLSSATKLGGNVSNTQSYWVCYVPDGTFEVGASAISGSDILYLGWTSYSNMPQKLSGSWTYQDWREVSVYVEVE